MTTNVPDSLHSTPPKMPIWLKLCPWIGLACVGQFFIFALIGVIRGYSVQSMAPLWVMLGGLILLLLSPECMIAFYYSKEAKRPNWISYLSSFCLILMSVVGLLQGRYQKLGDEFYEQKNYLAAITMYQKEVDTWYLRLRYNTNENTSLFGIARSYCQMENFEQGRQAYQRLHQMARGYYQERSREELVELDKELGSIAEYEKQFASAADDNQKAQILFDMALSYRRIECDKKATEQYALIQTLNIDESRKEQARKFAVNEL
jgi:tetratricopeptide (TPR) repeat protein